MLDNVLCLKTKKKYSGRIFLPCRFLAVAGFGLGSAGHVSEGGTSPSPTSIPRGLQKSHAHSVQAHPGRGEDLGP